MPINYVEVDATNIDSWRQPIYDFARTLDANQRCNVAAVAAQRWDLTYPSLVMLNEFVDRDALIVVAQDTGTVNGYLIATDDSSSNGKYGGCYCRWIGMPFMAPPQKMAEVYAGMGDIAVARYGWLWGRVSHPGMRNIMIMHIDGCELGIDGEDQIVTYKKP
jgi:hypothetical protein